MSTYLIVGISILILLIFVASVMVYHASKLRETINSRWKDLWLMLYHRHNLLPNLLETFNGFFPNEKKFFYEIIESKNKAAVLSKPDIEKLNSELDLSLKIAQAMEKISGSKDMMTDTNFLELRNDLKQNSVKVEGALVLYNDKIHDYNNFLERPFVRLLCVIFSLKRLHVFEYEAGVK